MKKLILPLVLASFATAGDALAKEYVIVQKDKAFIPAMLDVKVGDTLTFANEEGKKIKHNVYTEDKEFKYLKIKLQKPGEKNSIVVQSAGTVEVRCAMHPKMKLVLNITE